MDERSNRDRQIQRVILAEGAANVLVLLGKFVVGISTGSLAILGDAVHSLTDVLNNLIAWGVVKVSSQPADREHPYGHRKFETLAVFGLATLLAVLAVELALHAIRRDDVQIAEETWMLAVMLAVLATNIVIALWQRYWAGRLKSDILYADANHTFGDVLTTVAVIGGWQLSARGYPWLDSICTLAIAVLVMYLAYGLFKRALPVLVDKFAVEPEMLIRTAKDIVGVRNVARVRSRWVGSHPAIDMIVTVDPCLSTTESHEIANSIEKLLEERFQARDIFIHIEPHV